MKAMYRLEIAAGIASLLIWAYLLCFRGRFWHISRALPTPSPPAGTRARVAVIIPARNEAEVVGRCTASLLRQRTRANVHLIVVDDNSTDETGRVVGDTAKRLGRCDSVTVMRGRPLAEGWTGKLWAVQQGIEAARPFDPDYLLLTDADVVHAPDSLEKLLAWAQAGAYDLTSQMVKLHCRSFAEKLLIPAFVFFFFKLYPPAWTAHPQARTAGAAGGCLLISPEALARAGGLETIRGEIIDDCALARAVKGSGGRVYLGLTADTASIRAYTSFGEIGRMIARTAFKQLHHSAWLLIAAVVALAITYVAPVALLFSGRALPTALGAVAWLMMTVAYLPMIGFYGLNWLWAPALPFSALFYMGATVRSALNFWSRRGGEWKGRAQDGAHSTRNL